MIPSKDPSAINAHRGNYRVVGLGIENAMVPKRCAVNLESRNSDNGNRIEVRHDAHNFLPLWYLYNKACLVPPTPCVLELKSLENFVSKIPLSRATL